MDYSFLVGLHFGDELSTSSEGSCTSSSQGVPNLYDSFEHHESMDEPCLLDSTSRCPKIEYDKKNFWNRMQISLGMNIQPGPNKCFLMEEDSVLGQMVAKSMSKKLEHAYKSSQVDPTSISAVDPKLYSRDSAISSRVFVEDD
ncbi:hypothetical protein HPP92_016303 [Vanilla planifolia]|uniref:1-phosphatidylinositol-4-phosphate 5-kinase n=1 Tax=Vanilla planifolia TaxID=51239 RepID=A0A835QDU8_VANPL|nr:hypothetical protein HPP92_016303 [Vanilla planifolia]